MFVGQGPEWYIDPEIEYVSALRLRFSANGSVPISSRIIVQKFAPAVVNPKLGNICKAAGNRAECII